MKKVLVCIVLFLAAISVFCSTDYQVLFKNDTHKTVLVAFIRQVEEKKNYAFMHFFLEPYQTRLTRLMPTDRFDITFDYDRKESTYQNQAGTIVSYLTEPEGLRLTDKEGSAKITLREGASLTGETLPSIYVAKRMSVIISANFAKNEIYIAVHQR